MVKQRFSFLVKKDINSGKTEKKIREIKAHYQKNKDNDKTNH